MHTIIPLIRRQRKIKQKVMAEALDVSPSYLCKIEKGIQNPNRAFKEACAAFLELSVEELFPDRQVKKNFGEYSVHSSNKLWDARRDKGIKQKKLASLLGCSPSYLSKVEKGLQTPNEKFKKKCAKILKIKEVELFP
ncbi:MAG TPA: helix-turn-helix transcriptional regulator [Spirochaetota bacterium]|nr:helix-turn-helix transcriptional regulator [Spirochaetota bacterium]HPI88823.1 helix-turn-helix transcriptional regulator [Spirochaetota bacterium]HPR47689.1 helix-turn-helix transcriptional regulator [Spirochaetota bacterium]